MARLIGFRHRVKQTREGEARPTMVAVKDGEFTKVHELETETDELDFVLGRFPTGWHFAEEGENLSEVRPHHQKKRKKAGATEESTQVPTGYDGLAAGDTVCMMFGGSGDRLAYALSRRGDDIGAAVYRVPPFMVVRGEGVEKDDDHKSLVELYLTQPGLFYHIGPRDRDFIAVSESYRARRDAQKERIKCDQRLRQRAIGAIFLTSDGLYPEGTIEDAYDALKASDIIFQNLVREEGRREAELRKLVVKLDVWEKIFEGIEGCGEVLAAGIMSPIGDIRRFSNREKLKKFAGVHVLPDGRFARRRLGTVANWNPQLRQALYNLADQWVKRKESHWGLVQRAYKVKLREKHPEVVVGEGGKKRYTNGHIHKMASWRTITKFVEWLHEEWTRHEVEVAKQAK